MIRVVFFYRTLHFIIDTMSDLKKTYSHALVLALAHCAHARDDYCKRSLNVFVALLFEIG